MSAKRSAPGWRALALLVALTLSAWTPVAAQVQTLEQLEAKYGIEIVLADEPFPVKTRHGDIGGESASKAELEAYIPLLVFEFGIYPPELVRTSKLERIVLCRKLSFAAQIRNAVPDFGNSTLYLEVVRGIHAEGYMRRVVHHEFFHIIDWRDDGKVYSDPRWSKLNPPDFEYGSGGKNAQGDATMSLLTRDYPGFLTKYATTGVEEDKAVVFAHLVVDPDIVAVRAREDFVLGKKCTRMRALLADFCPKLDHAFWKRVGKLKRPKAVQKK